MKICFLFPHPFSTSLGSTRRVLGLARTLEVMGQEVFIVTPFEKSRTVDGLKIVGIPNISLKMGFSNITYSLIRSMSSNKLFCKFLLRNIDRLSLKANALHSVLKQIGPDILQVVQEPAALYVLPILNRLSIPVVLELHGLTEELIYNGVLTRQSQEFQMLENKVTEAIKSMDGVVVMTKEMKQCVVERYEVPEEKVHIVELGAEPRLTHLPQRTNPPKVIYAGILSREKHADLFLNSISYIDQKKNIRFYVTRRGDMLKEVHRIGKTQGMSIADFWFSDEDDLFRFMSTCNVGILTLPHNLSYQLSPSTKLFDYMSVGLPIVANDIGGCTSIIKEEGVGILTSDDPQEFAKGISELIDNHELARKFGQRGLAAIKEKYSLYKVTEKLLDLYESISQ